MTKNKFPKGSPEWFGQQGGRKTAKIIKAGKKALSEKKEKEDTCYEHESPEKDDIRLERED